MLAEFPTRIEVTSLPPLAYGAAVEVLHPCFAFRADATTLLPAEHVWTLTLAPLTSVGEWKVGPLGGLAQTFDPVACPSFCDPRATAPAPLGFVVGAYARWERDRWWVALAPNVSLVPRPALPPIPGSGGPFIPQAPFWNWLTPIAGCPPVLEVGYQFTPAFGLALRASLTPLALSWKI